MKPNFNGLKQVKSTWTKVKNKKRFFQFAFATLMVFGMYQNCGSNQLPSVTSATSSSVLPTPTGTSTPTPNDSPIFVQTIVGQNQSCAISDVGNVFCWGVNSHGELGDGSTITSASPVEVHGVNGSGFLSGIVQVSVGNSGTLCALSAAGNVYCWGYGLYGDLGNNGASSSTTPVEVVGSNRSGYLSGISQVTVGNSGTVCAFASSGTVLCWGNGTLFPTSTNQTPSPTPTASPTPSPTATPFPTNGPLTCATASYNAQVVICTGGNLVNQQVSMNLRTLFSVYTGETLAVQSVTCATYGGSCCIYIRACSSGTICSNPSPSCGSSVNAGTGTWE
jgi:hypothetical protein